MDAADLERRAVEEILREAKNAAERAREMGTAGWLKPAVPPTNKRFLHNTLVSTMRPLYREPRMRHRGRRSRSISRSRSRTRSRSPHKSRRRSSERKKKPSNRRKQRSRSPNGIDRHKSSSSHKNKSDESKKTKDNANPGVAISKNKDTSQDDHSKKTTEGEGLKNGSTKDPTDVPLEPCKKEEGNTLGNGAATDIHQSLESADGRTDEKIISGVDINGDVLVSQADIQIKPGGTEVPSIDPAAGCSPGEPQTDKQKHKKSKKKKKKKKGHKKKSHKKHKTR